MDSSCFFWVDPLPTVNTAFVAHIFSTCGSRRILADKICIRHHVQADKLRMDGTMSQGAPSGTPIQFTYNEPLLHTEVNPNHPIRNSLSATYSRSSFSNLRAAAQDKWPAKGASRRPNKGEFRGCLGISVMGFAWYGICAALFFLVAAVILLYARSSSDGFKCVSSHSPLQHSAPYAEGFGTLYLQAFGARCYEDAIKCRASSECYALL